MVKIKTEQGDLLKIEKLSYPVMVVSNTYFNRAEIEQQFLIISHSILKNKGRGTAYGRRKQGKMSELRQLQYRENHLGSAGLH